MKRNFGFSNETESFYSAEDFKDGCSFNYWMGTGAGIFGTIVVELIFCWLIGVF